LPPRPISAAKRWRLRICASVGAVLLALVVLELVGWACVRLFGIPTKFQPQPFQGFGQTDPVLWWTLEPNLDNEAQGVRVRTNRLGLRDARDELPRDRPVVVCLGDSTTYGWSVEADEMYTVVAERLLAERGGPPAAVISAGVPGYTSYQCLVQFRERILPLRPTIVAVLASNNECRARSLGDRDRGRLLARKQALDSALGFSNFWLLLTRGPESLRRSWELEPVPGRVANTVDECRQNFGELIRLARDDNVQIIVLSAPLRLRFEPNWKNYDQPAAAVAELLRRAQQAALDGAPIDEQLAHVEAAVRFDRHQFIGHWRLAQLYSQLGRTDDAAREFSLARDADRHPEAAKPLYNRALAEFCESASVPFIDLDHRFAASGLRDDELFLDHCHPSPAGQQLIGEAIADELTPMLSVTERPRRRSLDFGGSTRRPRTRAARPR